MSFRFSCRCLLLSNSYKYIHISVYLCVYSNVHIIKRLHIMVCNVHMFVW